MDCSALFPPHANRESGPPALDAPSAAEAEAAYRALPKTGCLLVRCPAERLPGVLPALERAGFHGLVLRSLNPSLNAFELLAFKGKAGACHDTGRTARYLGSAAAVLDDDGHLLSGTARVCEKTAALYTRPPYADRLAVSPPDPALPFGPERFGPELTAEGLTAEGLARLERDPLPFTCATFEDDARRLAAALADAPASDAKQEAILYPGPFKLLVLKDGSVVRRGLPVRVAANLAQDLVAGEGAVVLTGRLMEIAAPAEIFPLRYAQAGAGFLLETFTLNGLPVSARPADLESLDRAPTSLRTRLRRMLERGAPYFLATGSDPREARGCCPSGEVGAANRLVEAGVLQAWRSPAPSDACPVTFYAFAGEIGPEAGPPVFSANRELREAVRARLQSAGRLRAALRAALRVVLLAFVAVSAGYAWFGDSVGAGGSARRAPLGSALGLPRRDLVLVGLFRGYERCAFCNRMEACTREALQTSFAEELRAGRVVFREINTDEPEWRLYKQRYGLFTSSIVLVDIRHGEEGRWKVFSDAWRLTEEPAEFEAALRAELRAFLKQAE